MADHFLLKSSNRTENFLPLDDGLAIDAHARLTEVLRNRIGPDAARLFAEPFVSRDKSGQQIHVAWYGPQGGEARRLDDLDAAARRMAEDRLHVLLPRIEALGQEPGLAPLIQASLMLTSATDILTVDGFPVLVNWGILGPMGENPLGGYLRAAALAAPVPASLGPAAPVPAASLPAAPHSPITGTANPGGGPQEPSSSTASTAAAPYVAPQPLPPPHLPGPQQPGRLPRVAWVPLVVLLALAGLTLAWILWPGTRIFPEAAAGAITPDVVDAISRDELDGLRARRAALQTALNGAQCRPDGRLVLPGNISPEGLTVPDPGAPGQSEPGPVAPDAPVAPAPDRVSVPRGASDGQGNVDGAVETSTLLAKVEASTVLVLAAGPEGLSTGSGFVIAPGLIVTNRHVVDGAAPDRIYVTNAALGKAELAKVLKSEGPFEDSGRDFALLQIASTSLPSLGLADPATSQKLHHVVAAGFPGDVMETDAGFNRLIQGDASAIPDLVVVDGTINAHQDMPHDAEVLVHSAPLSSGNSGGPLVDLCGRVIGVNTFVRQGPMRTLNFAVATSTLARFLAGTAAAVSVQTSDCAPNVMPVPETAPAAVVAPADGTPPTAAPDAAKAVP